MFGYQKNAGVGAFDQKTHRGSFFNAKIDSLHTGKSLNILLLCIKWSPHQPIIPGLKMSLKADSGMSPRKWIPAVICGIFPERSCHHGSA